MKTLVSIAVAAALAPCVGAQKDRIVWTDGTVTADARVEDFTWREVRYRAGGQTETRPADGVAELDIDRVREAYRTAFGSQSPQDQYANFLKVGQELAGKDRFLAQFGYANAARVAVGLGEMNDGFAVLEEMVDKLPDTGFYPELYRQKLDYYLSQGKDKARSAETVAKAYYDHALQKGWPDGFLNEATYYQLMTRAVAGEIGGEALTRELRDLLDKVDGAFPSVANRVRVQLGEVARQGGQLDDAKKIFNEIIDKPGVDEGTRARALLGLGHTWFAAGSSADTEAYRSAMLAFLKVYLVTTGAPPDAKAEALYHAAVSCERWRGPDSGQMAARLRGYLRRDYPDSVWATR